MTPCIAQDRAWSIAPCEIEVKDDEDNDYYEKNITKKDINIWISNRPHREHGSPGSDRDLRKENLHSVDQLVERPEMGVIAIV